MKEKREVSADGKIKDVEKRMAKVKSNPPADHLSQLKEEVVSLLQSSQSLDSPLVRSTTYCLKKIARGREIPPLISKLLISLTPFLTAPLISLFTKEPIFPSIVLLVFTSLTIFLSLWGLEKALRGWKVNAWPIVDLFIDCKDLQRAKNWVITAFNMKKQTIASLCFVFCFLTTAIIAALIGSYDVPSFVYANAFLAVLLIGNGFYWGIVSPRGFRAICSSKRLKVYSFDPSATVGIRKLSGIMGTHSIVGAIMILLGASGFLYINRQQLGVIATVVLIVWLIVGMANELYVFVNPQYRLYLAISREKSRILDDFQNKIDSMYSKMETMNAETLATIHKAIALHNSIKSTKNTTLNIAVVLQHISSALLPFAAYLATELNQGAIISFL